MGATVAPAGGPQRDRGGRRRARVRRRIPVNPAQAQALRAYFEQAPAFDPAQREQCYLLRLSLDPAIRRWGTNMWSWRAASPGGFAPLPEIRVRGDGPQREIERVPLPDIRDALQRHAHFILLAPPGAGKTTVLPAAGPGRGARPLHDPETARLPLVVRLAEQKADEDRIPFWRASGSANCPVPARRRRGICRRPAPGPAVPAVRCAQRGARDRLQERIDDWRDFAAALPAGNRLVFTCRTDDYDGRLKVQQVEIDPLDDGQIQQFAQPACTTRTPTPSGLRSPDRTPTCSRWRGRPTTWPCSWMSSTPTRSCRPTGQLLRALRHQAVEPRRGQAHPDWIDAAARNLALRQSLAMQSLGEGTEISRSLALAQPRRCAFPAVGLSRRPGRPSYAGCGRHAAGTYDR